MLKISASNLYRYFLCPSAMLHEQQRGNKTSKYAEEGTRKHKEMEEAFATPEGFSKSDAAQHLVNFLIEKTGFDFKIKNVSSEAKLEKDYATFKLFGTPDFIYSFFKDKTFNIYIIDYKFGYQKVFAEENKQLLAYALLCYEDISTSIYGLGFELNIHVGIYQDEMLDLIKIEDHFTIIDFKHSLSDIVEQAHKSQYNPTETGCKYCQQRPECHEVKRVVEATVKDIEENTNAPLTEEQKFEYRKSLIQNKKLVEYALEDAEDYFKSTLKSGAIFDFCELKSNGSMESWSSMFSQDDILADLCKSGREKGDFIDSKLKSVAQVKQILGEVPEHFVEVREKAKSLKVKERKIEAEKEIFDMF